MGRHKSGQGSPVVGANNESSARAIASLLFGSDLAPVKAQSSCSQIPFAERKPWQNSPSHFTKLRRTPLRSKRAAKRMRSSWLAPPTRLKSIPKHASASGLTFVVRRPWRPPVTPQTIRPCGSAFGRALADNTEAQRRAWRPEPLNPTVTRIARAASRGRRKASSPRAT